MSNADLFQLETDFETAFQSLLFAAGIANVYCSRESSDAFTPRAEVRFLPGAVDSRHRRRATATGETGRFVYNAYTGSQLLVDVITQRQDNATSHKTLLGKIRYECQYFRLLDTWPALDIADRHAIADLRESNSDCSINSDDDTDRTTLTFIVSHNIRDDAFSF